MNTFIYKCIHAHTFIYCIYILKSHTFILHSSLLSLRFRGSRVDLLDNVLHRKLDNDLHRLTHLVDLHLLVGGHFHHGLIPLHSTFRNTEF